MYDLYANLFTKKLHMFDHTNVVETFPRVVLIEIPAVNDEYHILPIFDENQTSILLFFPLWLHRLHSKHI